LEDYVKKYKPFLLFLAKFFVTYVLLTAAYQWYLSGYDQKQNQVDTITRSVAGQSESLLQLFGESKMDKHPTQPSIRLFYQKKYVARIIEGCNAVSVMILFAAFVVAFSGKLKQTILFILGGSALIHVLNIGRIALLCVLIYHFPQYENFLHGVIFPLIIYGVVFILWVIWVNKFSKYAKPRQ
jgi:exosortase family protein XrtF